MVTVPSDCEGVVAQANCRIDRLSGSLAVMPWAAEVLLTLMPESRSAAESVDCLDAAECALVAGCCAADVAVLTATDALACWQALVCESAVETDAGFSFGVTTLDCLETEVGDVWSAGGSSVTVQLGAAGFLVNHDGNCSTGTAITLSTCFSRISTS